MPNGSFEEGVNVSSVIALWYGYTDPWYPDGTHGWRGRGVVARGYPDANQDNACLPKSVPIPHGMYAGGVGGYGCPSGESISNVVTVAEAGDYVFSFHYVCGLTTGGRYYKSGHIVRVYLGNLEKPFLEVTNAVVNPMAFVEKTLALTPGTYPLVFTGVKPDTSKQYLTMIDDVRLYRKRRTDTGPTVTVDDKEYVYLTRDATVKNVFTNGAVWSDGNAPGDQADYLVHDAKVLDWLKTSTVFPGRSLRIGTSASAGTLNFTGAGGTDFYVTNCVLANGSINALSAPTDSRYPPRFNGRGTSITVTAPLSKPFVVRGNDDDLSYPGLFEFNTAVVSDADAALLITGEKGTGVGKGFTFNVEPRPFTSFKGRIIVEGTNTTYYYYRNGSEWDGVWGADPGSFEADAFTIRGGAKVSIKNYCFIFATFTRNRGMTIGEGGGNLAFSGQSNHLFAFPVAGSGDLKFAANSKTVLLSGMAPKSVAFTAGTSVCAESFTLGEETVLGIASGATFVTPAKGLSAKAVLENGSVVKAGVANGATISNQPGTVPTGFSYSLSRPRGHYVGTLNLREGSEIKSTPVTIGLEATDVIGGDERFPILTVPTSVREVTAADFDGGNLEVEVETEGTLQTVYLKRSYASCTYVVPPETPGVVPTSPYDTWATAATNLQTAINAAAANTSVRVKPGLYSLGATLSISKCIRLISCDESGHVAPETTIVDGGYPAAQRSCLSISSACSINGLTIRNGYASNGGGISISVGGVGIYDCVITNCVATGTGGAVYNSANDRSIGFAIERTTIVGCKAATAGAVYWWANSDMRSSIPTRSYQTPTFIGCRFLRNRTTGSSASGTVSGGNGGWSANGWFESCLFDGNSMDNGNSGYANFWIGSYGLATNCVFRNGSGEKKSVAHASSKLKYFDCVWAGNAGTGALGNGTGSTFERCVFTNNAMRLQYDSGHANLYRNCLMAANSQANVGSSTLENCTVASNTTYGINVDTSSRKPVLVNTIAADNAGGDVVLGSGVSASNVTLTNCCFSAASDELLARDAEGGSFVAKPRFRAVAKGDWRLKPSSPCRDKGAVLDWMTTDAVDLDRHGRVLDRKGRATADALPDIGSFECEIAKPGVAVLVK